MLLVSGRTKQVVSYGKRGKRVVARQEHDPFKLSTDSPSKLARASDKGENDVHSSRNAYASSKVGSHADPPPSPEQMYKPKRVAHIAGRKSPGRPVLTPRKGSAANTNASPTSGKPRATGKGKPLSKPSFTPFVDVDIIVLDDDGTKVSQEHRRVSKGEGGEKTGNGRGLVKKTYGKGKAAQRKQTGNRSASPPQEAEADESPPRRPSKAKAPSPIPISNDSNDDEDDFQPRRPARTVKTRPLVISSGSSNLEDDAAYDEDDNDNEEEEEDFQPRRPARTVVKRRPLVISSGSSNLEDEAEFLPSESEDLSPQPQKSKHKSKSSTVTASGTAAHPTLSPPPYLARQQGTHTIPHPAAAQIRPNHLTAPRLDLGPAKPARISPPVFAPARPRPLTPIRPGWRAALAQNTALSESDEDEDDLELALKLSRLGFPHKETGKVVEKSRQTLLSSKAQRELEVENNPPAKVLPPVAPQTQTQTKAAKAPTAKPQLASQPSYLLLLQECGQPSPFDFGSFIETFPFDALLQDCPPHTVQFRKIGEASYSEVFGIGDVVLKVVPLRDPLSPSSRSSAGLGEDTPTPSECEDVRKEIIVTRAMGETCSGFIRLLKTFVVRGQYPKLLLKLWDEYNDRKGSESAKPDCFTSDQLYAIFVLPNGGPDLEAFTFTKTARGPKVCWAEACSVFWQVARALSDAERLVRFEHRDLHWGQILVNRTATTADHKRTAKSARPLMMDAVSHGVDATIIDLGLARMDAVDKTGSTTYWTPFDDEIFEGEGDYQFDVYRMMNVLHRDNSWEDFRPLSNVMWLHYLVKKLLHDKSLRRPVAARKTAAGEDAASNGASTAAAVTPEKRCYDSLVEMETLLGEAIKMYTGAGNGNGKPATGKGARRKTTVPSVNANSAGGGRGKTFQRAEDVLDFGIARGWIMRT